MIETFVLEYAKLISQEPERIKIKTVSISDDFHELILYAGGLDAGKLIGKDGKMISAIKTLVSGCKAKNGISYKVQVENIDTAHHD